MIFESYLLLKKATENYRQLQFLTNKLGKHSKVKRTVLVGEI